MVRGRRARRFARARSRPLPALAVAAGLVLGLLVPASSAAALAPHLSPIGGPARLPAQARADGAVSPSRVLEVGLALRLRDAAGLKRYAADVADPHNASYHHYLTPAEVAARFGPTESTRTTVTSALRRDGLSVLPGGGLLVRVRGSVGAIESALHTRLVGVRLASGARGWRTSSTPELAPALAAKVGAVIGLDNLLDAHALDTPPQQGARSGAATEDVLGSVSATPVPCSAAARQQEVSGGWTFSDLAAAYGLSGLWTSGGLGAGESIDVFELEPFLRANVSTFDRCYFGESHVSEVTALPVDGFTLGGTGPSGEATLDVEVLSALAPDAHLYVYDAPNTVYGAIDEYDAIVTQDRANLVTTSWGECEAALDASAPGAIQVENELFEEAAAQGQSVFASSGDTGSDDCAGTQFSTSSPEPPYLSVDDPAAQPEVLAVGGTALRSDVAPLGDTAETVWNDGPRGGGSGGGFSAIWAEPSWQADSGVEGVPASGKRPLPDVSIDADPNHGVGIYQNGWSTIGGTSLAAPTWTAIAADVATSAGCAALPENAGGADLGFVPPELYEVASVDYSSAFNDVTLGSNDVFGRGLGYAASAGFDEASGLGSPIVTSSSGPALAADWCAAALGTLAGTPSPDSVTGLEPASGPIAGGETVTISGSFGDATPVEVGVDFGANAASVTSVTSDAITVAAPAATVTPVGKLADGAGPQVVTVTVHSGSQSVTSFGGAAAVFDYVSTSGSTTIPTVTDVGPGGGPRHGGNLVTILGSGFGPTTPTVTFGGVSSRSVRVVSSDKLIVRVPALRAATRCTTGAGFLPANDCQVEVVVHEGGRSSHLGRIRPARSGALPYDADGVIEATPTTEVTTAPTEYDYAPPPVVTSVTPDPMEGHGGGPVTITGSGFDLNTLEWINFGPSSSESSEQTTVTYVSPTQIVIASPVDQRAAASGTTVLGGGISVQSVGGLSKPIAFAYVGEPSLARGVDLVVRAHETRVVHLDGDALGTVTSVELRRAGPERRLLADLPVLRRSPVAIEARLGDLAPGRYALRACTATACSDPLALVARPASR